MDSTEKKTSRPKSVFLSRMSDPKKFRDWYIDYLLSDFTYAAFVCAVLAMIKVYFRLDWTQFWNSMILFYTVWIAVMVSKIVKRFCDGKINK